MSTGKFSTTASRVPIDRVFVRFGPEVRRHLQKLEDIARNNSDFGYEMHEIIRTLNSNRPLDIASAMTRLAMVVRDTTEYVQRTGDPRAGNALNETIGHLMGQSQGAQPVIVTVEPKHRAR